MRLRLSPRRIGRPRSARPRSAAARLLCSGMAATALALTPPASARAAIDCSKAATNTEKLLCSNSRLAKADELLALAFREALHRGVKAQQLMDSQRVWIREVRDVCNDVECLLRAYEERVSELQNAR